MHKKAILSIVALVLAGYLTMWWYGILQVNMRNAVVTLTSVEELVNDYKKHHSGAPPPTLAELKTLVNRDSRCNAEVRQHFSRVTYYDPKAKGRKPIIAIEFIPFVRNKQIWLYASGGVGPDD